MGKKSISLNSLIIISFIILIITTNSIIFYNLFSNWKASADNIIKNMEKDINRDIINKIDAFISVPLYINAVNQSAIKNGIVDIYDRSEREAFFAGVMLSNNPEVYSFSYGTRNGEYYGARRNINNEIEIMRSDAETEGRSTYYSLTEDLTSGEVVESLGKFDPRTRDWYKIAEQNGKPVFSPIYRHFVMNDLALSASYPIYDNEGALKGVLGTHIILSDINSYLNDLVKDKKAQALIIEKDSGMLVANSYGAPNFQILPDNSMKRILIEDIESTSIKDAYEKYKNERISNFIVKTYTDNLHISFTNYSKEGLDWLIVTAISESLLTAEIKRNINTALFLTIAAIIVSIFLYIKSMGIILSPIYDLINTAEKFSKGDLLQRARVFRNDEIGKLADAFNKMAEELYMHINTLEEKVRERTKKLESTNKALREREESIRLLMDSTAEGIYGIDTDGNCAFCNASSLKILGYKNKEDLIGKKMHMMIHHKHPDGTPMPIEECKVIKAFTKGEGVHVDDEVFWRADGTCFPAEYFSYPQFRDGKVIGAVVTFTDITERKTAQNELIKAKEQAEAANIAKSQFLASMSHEIRTPINGIIGFLQLLENTDLNNEQQEFVDAMKTSTDTLLNVINDILDISKIEAGKLELENIPFNIFSTIERAVIPFAAKAREKGLKLNMFIRPDIPRYVMGDPTKLKQVIGNLVSNGVKFTDKGEVLIQAALNKKTGRVLEILFTVKDTGIGMSDEEMSKLFKPFTQVDSSSTRKYGGTGLGLAICKSIVEKMGGEISAESEKGKGTRFSFTVKLHEVEDIDNLDDPDSAVKDKDIPKDDDKTMNNRADREVYYNSSLKILVVEDNEINRKVFVKLLNNRGLDCDVAINGLEAVEACDKQDYDIIFMDCQMPVMDGYEATRQIRKKEGNKRHAFIVAMTAYAMKGDAEKCLDAGMDAYLSKPINHEQVVKILRKFRITGMDQYSKTKSEDYHSDTVKALMEELDFDRETCEEILELFYQQTKTLINDIKINAGMNNFEEAAALLHRLKGSAGNARVKEVASYALMAEDAVKTGDVETLYRLVDKIEKILDALRKAETGEC